MRLLYLLIIILPIVTSAQKKVLHYDETTGFDHNTRTESFNFFKSLESSLGMEVVQDSDGSEFTMNKLMNYDLVIFSNTSGNSGLTALQREALEWFIDVKGGGLIGIHAATDTYRHSSANGGSKGTWDWYAETMGGSVQQSPNHTSNSHVNTMTQITASPITANLTLPWTKEEEYYYWENGYLNEDNVDLLLVGDTGGNSYDDPRPMAWKKTNTVGSRVFYTALGHKRENFTGPGFPQFRQLLEDATTWTLEASSVLPVELIRFELSHEKSNVVLSWETSSEINSDFFEIQRSSDRIEWTAIASVSSNGNTQEKQSYFFLDRNPYNGTSYYRLRSVDVNGEYSFSPMRKIEREGNIDLTISPNPTNGFITLFLSTEKEDLDLVIRDINGRILMQNKYERTSEVQLDLSNFQSGMYFIHIQTPNKESTTKVLKN